MCKLENEMQLAGDTDASVLLTGENGVGKRSIAHIIHQLSKRRRAPFVAVNAADPFAGDFPRADGGTLLIQDVERTPADVQLQLLGLMDTTTTARKPVRLMSSSTADLFGLMEAGSFRDDLYYRLNVIALNIPPLRERPEDLPMMFRLYVSLHAGTEAPELSTAAERRLMEYSWPGNIAELTNVTRTLSSRTLPDIIDLEHLPCPLGECQSPDKRAATPSTI